MKINTIEMVRKIRDKLSQELLQMSNKEIIDYFHTNTRKSKKQNENVVRRS